MSNSSETASVTTGVLLSIAAVFFLCSMDAVVKSLVDDYDVMQMVWVRYVGQTTLALVLIGGRLPKALRTRHLGFQVLRSMLLFGGTIGFFIGFSRIGLAAATTILQTSPLFVALAASLFLGERLGWQRIAGIAVGLLGAMIIIRPGNAEFSYFAVFPLFAAVGYSGYAVITRLISRDEDVWTSFLYTSLFGSFAASLIVPFHWTTPELSDLPFLVLIAVLATTGQLLLVLALFRAEATVVAPFGYSSLVFSAIYGALVFGEIPDVWTYVGAIVVVGSGLLVWFYESRKGPFDPIPTDGKDG